MEKGRNPTVGTLAHLGQVDIRIAAKGEDAAETASLIAPVEAEIRERLGDVVFGADDDTLESRISAGLLAAGARLAIAEIGTAGIACERLAGLPDGRFAGGMVLTDTADAERLSLWAARGGDAQAEVGGLAEAAARWAAAEVGGATCVGTPGPSDSTVPVALGVSLAGTTATRSYRLGGDAVSMRIRAATLLLDLIRRTVPAPEVGS
jgi:nicotinamide-nucleotide amidase